MLYVKEARGTVREAGEKLTAAAAANKCGGRGLRGNCAKALVANAHQGFDGYGAPGGRSIVRLSSK